MPGELPMNDYVRFPDVTIEKKGVISGKFLNLGISMFRDACRYVHNLPYGYNSDRDDVSSIFKEGFGTCTTKHSAIAVLAKELGIPVFKSTGIYAMTEDIVSGTDVILGKYDLPYIPMIHCFLVYGDIRADLTLGNDNGKKKGIDEFLYTELVESDISEKDEYLIYRKALKESVLGREEMKGIDVTRILKARQEGLELLRSKVAHED
jgi:hypothetical protein